MILKQLFALALFATTSAFASASFLVDFEKTWDYSNGDVNGYYNGGIAGDGTFGGPNLGVSFTGVSGLSNDVGFPLYYDNAPSMQGTAYAYGPAYMNVIAGVDTGLSFFYSSPNAVNAAVKAYSGPSGTGNLLGSLNLAANTSGTYDAWTPVTFLFSGTAQSFDFTAGANIVGLDNISNVPEPAVLWLFGTGLAMFGAVSRRGKASV